MTYKSSQPLPCVKSVRTRGTFLLYSPVLTTGEYREKTPRIQTVLTQCKGWEDLQVIKAGFVINQQSEMFGRFLRTLYNSLHCFAY